MFPPKRAAAVPTPGGDAAARLIVAVKAEKVISKSALAWALTHAAGPGDSITLLAIVSHNDKFGGRRFWGFPRLKGGDDRSGGGDTTKLPDRISQISQSCSEMVIQVHHQIQVRVRIKVVTATSAGAVTAEAKSNAANWVILDKKLKQELKHCMDELRCNIVVMKGSHPKVLRLNLSSSSDIQTPFYSAASSPIKDSEHLHSHTMKYTTPVSSPEDPNTSCTRTSWENSISSPDTEISPFVVYEQNPLYERLSKGKYSPRKQNALGHLSANTQKTALTSVRGKLDTFMKYKYDVMLGGKEIDRTGDGDCVFNSSIREAVSLAKTSSIPPPLCSLCQSKAPAFGKPPKQFHYKELEEATDSFSDENFVAEGLFGLVHKGVLQNGLIIAVKQLKLVGPQRDADFSREVRVLSCAQHRNVVLLIGFCIEGKKRLLVYEYICNNSLDFHLHGNERPILDWNARLKIAIGTARGLRYLHEDCRMGCIIHRNLRPNNILLTHDFEPLVTDFGLARLHGEWEFPDRTQIIGTSGYLAPEYYNDGEMTEKVDIYAFGLILLELITGQKAHDLQHRIKHQFLLDNIHALASVEPIHILAYKHQLLDPCLASCEPQGLPFELHAMGYAASLCLQQDPHLRPPMSKVVKVLEGGSSVTPLALDMGSVGCRSGHMKGLDPNTLLQSKIRHSRRLSY